MYDINIPYIYSTVYSTFKLRYILSNKDAIVFKGNQTYKYVKYFHQLILEPNMNFQYDITPHYVNNRPNFALKNVYKGKFKIMQDKMDNYQSVKLILLA